MKHLRIFAAIGAVSFAAAMPSNVQAQTIAHDQSALVSRLLPSVVSVMTKSMVKVSSPANTPTASGANMRTQESFGSGFVIDKAGYVLTNRHVVDKAYEIVVTLSDRTSHRATLVGAGRKTDIALLRINPTKPLQPVKFGDSDALKVGEPVIAIGNPFGLGTTVTSGIVSALNRDLSFSRLDSFIQTDAAINHGNSGGPLFDMKGEVVGVNTAYYTGGLAKGGFIGIGYSIPSLLAKEAAGLIRKYGYLKLGWIGVGAQAVTPQIAEALTLKTTRGAIVASVDPKGPANGQLQTGDVITHVGKSSIRDPRALYRATAPALGQPLTVEYLRDGHMRTATLTPVEWPGEEPPPGKVDRPSQSMPTWRCDLGYDVSMITDKSRREFRLTAEQKGVVVTDVKADSAAAAAGFATGDVILAVQKSPVNSPKEVHDALDQAIAAKRSFVANLVQTASGKVWRTISLNTDLQ